MNDSCEKCAANFDPEPGFYFGAMFVSYAINVAIFISAWLVLYIFFNPDDWVYVITISVAALVATPLTFRFSRVLWLHWFGGIKPDKV